MKATAYDFKHPGRDIPSKVELAQRIAERPQDITIAADDPYGEFHGMWWFSDRLDIGVKYDITDIDATVERLSDGTVRVT